MLLYKLRVLEENEVFEFFWCKYSKTKFLGKNRSKMNKIIQYV